MKMIDKNALERLRWRFPVGSEVELQRMDDVQAPPPGTRGKVMFIDDDGTIHVAWNTGSTLGVVNGVDEILPVCPICQNAYSAHPAISRRDSETLICPDCGMREAMGAVGFKKEFQEEVTAEDNIKQGVALPDEDIGFKLGSKAFRDTYNLRESYVIGSMGRGISGARVLKNASKNGLLSIGGTDGLSQAKIRTLIQDAKVDDENNI